MGKKGDVPGRGQALSGIGFLQTSMESGFVPVGAGEVGMWGGDPCGRPRPSRWKDDGRPQGSPPNPSPPPPLRGRISVVTVVGVVGVVGVVTVALPL